jgi:adenosylhomocysteinase
MQDIRECFGEVSMDYKVKDIELAGKGTYLMRWAEDHMPVLITIRSRFAK